jgi:hypothetical protein
MPTSFRVGGRQHGSHAKREWTVGPAQSENPRTLRNNMHENREISSTSWSDDQGRSAKAISHTADMHVPEKSDCAVVPVNQPNKGGQPSAEVGEGRAQTKENIVPSHMHPTQSGKRSPRDWTVCGKQQRKESRSGSPLCSTTSTWIYSETATTRYSVDHHRAEMRLRKQAARLGFQLIPATGE